MSIADDSIAVNLLPALKKQFPDIRFKHVDPTEDWWEGETDVVIIDAVNGIEKPTLFTSLDAFQKMATVTPHDYDVYLDISLLLKLKRITRINIIGIPFSYPVL